MSISPEALRHLAHVFTHLPHLFEGAERTWEELQQERQQERQQEAARQRESPDPAAARRAAIWDSVLPGAGPRTIALSGGVVTLTVPEPWRWHRDPDGASVSLMKPGVNGSQLVYARVRSVTPGVDPSDLLPDFSAGVAKGLKKASLRQDSVGTRGKVAFHDYWGHRKGMPGALEVSGRACVMTRDDDRALLMLWEAIPRSEFDKKDWLTFWKDASTSFANARWPGSA